MKKFYLLFAAMIGFATVASAGVKNLYKQDFESAPNAEAAGWKSPNYPGGMQILGDEYGHYFQFDLGTQNNRNANLVWINNVNYEGVDTYEVDFSWALATNANNTNSGSQFSNEICLFTDSISQVNNGWMSNSEKAHWLFALTQKKGASGSDYYDTAGEMDFYVNNNPDDVFTPEVGFFYNISVVVDALSRTATYKIENSLTNAVEKEGVFAIPEEWPTLAAGLNVLAGRYGSKHQLDDIVVKSVIEGDIANDPTVALTAIDMKKRTFLITFAPDNDEVLHVKGTDGVENTYTESPVEYTTETSGTLEAWTVSGSAESAHIPVVVDCEPIVLPQAVATIIGVQEGFGKTWRISVDGTDVPTQPQLFINYEFKGESGATQSGNELLSGATITVTEKGVLTLTTIAYGFSNGVVEIVNDREFEVVDDVDFQHKTAEDLIAAGFVEIETLAATNMSGENNWTARPDAMRFNWVKGSEVGDTVQVRPYDVDHGGIRRFERVQSSVTEEVAHQLFAPVYTWFKAETDEKASSNLKYNLGIGIVNPGNREDDYSGALGEGISNAIMGVDGLTDDDFIVVSRITNYGRGATDHLYIAADSEEEAIAKYNAMNLVAINDLGNYPNGNAGVDVITGTQTFYLFRIQEAIARVQTFKAKGGENGIQELNAGKVVSDHNAPIYNLNGVQVKNLKKGVYVKQGKKFVVK